MSRTIAALIVGAATILPGTAKSQPTWLDYRPANEAGVRQARVGYADLNLSNPAGRDSLAHRVNYALKMVCIRDRGVRTTGNREADCRRVGQLDANRNVEAVVTARSGELFAAIESGVRR